MSDDHIQRKMDFIVEQQAKFSVDIELLKEAIERLKETQTQQAENINGLAENINGLAETVHSLAGEMQEGFNNLIVANEVTRNLSEEVARLAMQTSRRLDGLEEKM